jgi:hypothetical protein
VFRPSPPDSCDDSHNESVHYAVATTSKPAHCADCSESARNAILVIVGVVVVCAVAYAVLHLAHRHCLPAARKDQLQSAWALFTPHNKLKIVINFYQVVTKIDTVYEVELPPEVKQLLGLFSTWVTLGLSHASAVLECFGFRGYMATLTLYILIPVVVAATIIFIAAGCVQFAKPGIESPRTPHVQTSKGHTVALLKRAMPTLLQLAFLVYPVVTTKAFEAFSCYDFTASRYLKVDVAIARLCHSNSRNSQIP